MLFSIFIISTICLLCRWFGKCWYVHNLLKYEFDIEFDVSCLFLMFETSTLMIGLVFVTRYQFSIGVKYIRLQIYK